jgi:hypothetical protein
MWWMILVIGVFLLWMLAPSHDSNKIKIDPPVDKNLRNISIYFFTRGKFDFDKFCDYVLCINENMEINELAQSIMELDLLLKCSGDLNEKFLSIITYSEAIIGIDYREFEVIKQGIRDKRFKGSYQDLVYIFLSTIFYLKYQLALKKGRFNSYLETK